MDRLPSARTSCGVRRIGTDKRPMTTEAPRFVAIGIFVGADSFDLTAGRIPGRDSDFDQRTHPKTRGGSSGGFRPSPETAEILDEFRYDISRLSMIGWVLSHMDLIQRLGCLTWQGDSGFALLRFECETFNQLFVEFGDLPCDRFRNLLLARIGKHEGVENAFTNESPNQSVIPLATKRP